MAVWLISLVCVSKKDGICTIGRVRPSLGSSSRRKRRSRRGLGAAGRAGWQIQLIGAAQEMFSGVPSLRTCSMKVVRATKEPVRCIVR